MHVENKLDKKYNLESLKIRHGIDKSHFFAFSLILSRFYLIDLRIIFFIFESFVNNLIIETTGSMKKNLAISFFEYAL